MYYCKLLFSLFVLSFFSQAFSEDMQDFESDLLTKSYHEVPFSLGKQQISMIMRSYYAFLEEPPEVVSYICMKLDPKSRRSDLGYTQRKSEFSHFDDKEFFHYHPKIWEEYGEWIEDHPVVKEFLVQADIVWKAAQEALRTPLSLLDRRYPGLAAQYSSNHPQFLIRFLKYSPGKIRGAELAKGHFDAGSMTLAIAESSPGLRIGKDAQDLKSVAHSEYKALFFLASTFQKQVGDTFFHPAWHDVIRVSDSKIDESRWALVCFLEAPNVRPFSWESNHQDSSIIGN